MMGWDGLVEILGSSKASDKFIRLPQELNEFPIFDESVLGDRTYYSFLNSGILFLLVDDHVDQITLYVEADEGFSMYRGALPIPADSSEVEVAQLLGSPKLFGGGNTDMLHGYVNKWVKYDSGNFFLHLQFNRNDVLCRVTLMK